MNNDQIQNINGLSSIKTAYNVFVIENKKLKDCKGLAALTETEYIKISRNNSLVALQDNMPSLQSVEEISIYQNDILKKISDFKSLSKAFSIKIYNNIQLKSIEGFNKLKSVRAIQIDESPGLESLAGFNVVSKLLGGFTINAPISHLSGFDSTKIVNVFKISSSKLKQIDGFNKLDSCESITLEYNELLENLDNFSNITFLNSLKLFECPKLTSLSSFRNVLTCSYINISNMNELLTIDAFHNNKEINSISIGTAKKIKKLNAFENLQTVVNDIIVVDLDIETLNEFPSLLFCSRMIISSIPSLKKIKFNSSKLRMFTLSIDSNDNLEDISEIENLTLSTQTMLEILYNPKLSLCSYNSICEILKTPGSSAIINNNKTGCNSREEILASCITATDNTTDDKVSLVFPASMYDELSISHADRIDNLQIYTLQGLPIMTVKGSNVQKIAVGNLPRGLYLIKVTFMNKKIRVQKVVKM